MDYSVKTCLKLEEAFRAQKILRPLRIQRYEPGTELTYDIRGVVPSRLARVKLEVEQFVGGGFAGQVYKVKILELETPEGPIEGLQAGRSCALKIFIPRSGFSRFFRNLVYGLGFQGAFSIQVNPAAVRAGALWQKFIRLGARSIFGSKNSVVDVLATFIDHSLGSCGEISEWVEGRLWRLEADDNLDGRRRWKFGDPGKGLGSPEYRAKRAFMKHLVRLMRRMGAFELARQYEWWTCKSQPNVLKRTASDPDPEKGYVAVDFRAGLALLPFLPMSPADFKLILHGLARGSLVQFDRGSVARLEKYVAVHPGDFADMEEALEELKEAQKAYRDSLPDVTHHHLRLVSSKKLWSSILKGSIAGWKIRNIIDEQTQKRLSRKRIVTVIFYLLGLLPLLGNFLRRIWGNTLYRRHYVRLLSSFGYFRRAVRARINESLIRWHRSGRVNEKRASKLSRHPMRFFAHLPLAMLPAKFHRFFSDRRFFLHSLDYLFARPFRLYFRAAAREAWLRGIISRGQKSGTLTELEAARIDSQIKEPFIQKYLKSLAVHVCTAPVTQIVSVIIALIYVRLHPELSWQEAMIHAGIILGLFQVTPISPGSLVRGLYVSFVILRERNLKDYSIALSLSFFKYIGYLAFPIQMAYRYPELARLMAGHWATGAVHIVPVFGEKGALLEHAVFDLFYNYPLTIRRRLRRRRELRKALRPRYWHLPLCVLGGMGLLGVIDLIHQGLLGKIPEFNDIWWLVLWVPVLAGVAASVWAGGAGLARRILYGSLCGVLVGFFTPILNALLEAVAARGESPTLTLLEVAGRSGPQALWRMFLFGLVAFAAAVFAETRPLKRRSFTKENDT